MGTIGNLSGGALWAFRAAVIAGWSVALAVIAQAGDVAGLTLFALALAVSVAAGFLCGTWWALIVPPVVAVTVVALSAADPDLIEGSNGDTALAYGFAAALASGCMATGVLLRRAVERVRRA